MSRTESKTEALAKSEKTERGVRHKSSNRAPNGDHHPRTSEVNCGAKGGEQTKSVTGTSPLKSEMEKVLSHWFLLESDWIEAIQKGNHELLPAASARVDFLIKQVHPDLLVEGLKGDEDALWSILQSLYNNGSWERARNLVISGTHRSSNKDSDLLAFIENNKHLVHPNTYPRAREGDLESTRMALNQIHYGSLSLINKKANKDPKMQDQERIIASFLKNQSKLVEPSVLRDALAGDDKAVSMALGQIHHHSLSLNSDRPKSPYKEALLQSPKAHSGNLETARKEYAPEGYKDRVSKVSPPPRTSPPRSGNSANRGVGHKYANSIFFTGMSSETRVVDIWQHFKKAGRIRDIILPRKRDRFGNRIGFAITHSESEAEGIIRSLQGSKIGSNKLYLALAKNSRSVSPTKKGGSRPPKIEEVVRLESPVKEEQFRGEAKPKSISSNGHTPVRSTVLSLEMNVDLKDELKDCLCLITAKPETVNTVEFIVAGLGFRDAIIRGVSTTKFLAFFDSLALFDKEDIDFLNIGFMEVRKVQDADLVPPRKVWLELRGLPITGWTEDNLVKLVKKWGSVTSFGQVLDNGDCYCTPRIQIESDIISSIEEDVEVDIMGTIWYVKVIETLAQEVHYDVNSNLHPDTIEDEVEGVVSKDQNDDTLSGRFSHHSELVSDRVSEINDVSDVEVEDSLLNPPTPRPIAASPQKPQGCEVMEEDIGFQTANWKPREKDSSLSVDHQSIDQGRSESDYNPHDDLSELCNSNPSILKDLKNLKVQPKRGRPRKNNPKHLNKHFKLPRKKKAKGEGLQQSSHFFLNSALDESEAIFDTGVLMGLLPLQDREESIRKIKANLL